MSYKLLRIGSSLLLLTAAGLKLNDWRMGAVVTEDIGGVLPATLPAIAAETMLAYWLLIGVYPLAVRGVTIATFGGFAVTSAAKALGGEASCGCFGTLVP